ncbi:MAG TPA: DUF6515 family protein [Puia sp.]|jgi:hypothetical protein
MKALFNNNRFIITAFLLAVAGILSTGQGMAQRFNHGGGGNRGGGAPPPRPAAMPAQRPMSAPAQRPVSPAPSRQAEVRPVAAPVENRTINGGSRNFGNHDFNRNANANVHENVTVHQNVDVHQHVTVRDHENVYHTGGYRGIHPYYYHPYRPSYWGPHWHPFGFFLSSLAADAVMISIANQRYYYEDGVYYEPSNGGYSVVPPPVGAVVSFLPQGYETTMVGNDTYYYYGGAFYINNGQGYQVVDAPPGAVIVQLPVGAQEQQINGDTYLVYNNAYYQPISQDGEDAYEVVTPN